MTSLSNARVVVDLWRPHTTETPERWVTVVAERHGEGISDEQLELQRKVQTQYLETNFGSPLEAWVEMSRDLTSTTCVQLTEQGCFKGWDLEKNRLDFQELCDRLFSVLELLNTGDSEAYEKALIEANEHPLLRGIRNHASGSHLSTALKMQRLYQFWTHRQQEITASTWSERQKALLEALREKRGPFVVGRAHVAELLPEFKEEDLKALPNSHILLDGLRQSNIGVKIVQVKFF